MAATARKQSSGRRWRPLRSRVRPSGACSRRSRTCSLPVWRARSPLMRSGVCLITAALTIGAVGSVAAQGPPTLRVALEDALAKATEASHRLAEARAREDGAQAGVAIRESAERPTVTASAGYTRTNHVL